MTLLDDYRAGLAAAIHMMIVGHTKMGKTRYLADAARAGFTVVYVDGDNGKATLMDSLADDPAAMARVHYFNPENMVKFVESFLTMGVFRYSPRLRRNVQSMDMKEGDEIIEIIPSRFPYDGIFSIDSWTSLAYSAVSNQAKARSVSLEDIDKFSREIYGGSGFAMTNIAALLQQAPYHVVIQAHPGAYERKEKPPGRVDDVKEKDMIIKETQEVPISSSMPHGATLGKYFNQIGYLTINNANQRQLDFRVIKGRLGGGTPKTAAGTQVGDPLTEFSFNKLWGPPKQAESEGKQPWLTSMTAEEFKERQAAAQSTRPKLAGGSSTATKPTTPTPKPTAAGVPKLLGRKF